MTSLYEFVAAARDRGTRLGFLARTFDEEAINLPDWEHTYQEIEDGAKEVVCQAWLGAYYHAVDFVRVYEKFPWANELAYDESRGQRPIGYGFGFGPGWFAFVRACELADRIDGFLAALERGGMGASLARRCRQDLDTLPVLADWCDESGLPLAAAEARHLHGLVRLEMQ